MINAVIAFLVGICSLHGFASVPSLPWVIFGVVLISLSLMVLYAKKSKRVVWVIAFSLGFLWAVIHATVRLDNQLPTSLENKAVVIRGHIASVPEYREGTAYFEFQTSVMDNVPTQKRLKLRWYAFSARRASAVLQPGDEWSLTVKVKRPHGLANPGGWDVERYFFHARLVGEGHVVHKMPAQRVQSQAWHAPIDRLREHLRSQIQKALPGHPFTGIITALVVGIRDGITHAQWEVFQKTGTAHLMAISGLHVGLVASFAFFLGRFFWSRLPPRYLMWPAQHIGALCAIGAAVIYALLAGLSVPTQRAVIMVVVFMLDLLRRRKTSVWHRYCLALGIVLLWDPLSTLTASFWLSFGTVGMILYGMQGRIRPQGLWWRWGRAQWVAFLGLGPVSLAAFQTISWVSPVANWVAIPWVSFVVAPAALLGIAVHPCLGWAEQAFGFVWPLLEKLSVVRWAVWTQMMLSPWMIVCAVLGVLLLLAPPGVPGRFLGWIGLLPIFFVKPLIVQPGSAHVTVLDVGQGLAAVIETQKHVLIFDTGPKLGKRTDAGAQVILPFLATRGRTHVDTVFVSHGDTDHSGGVLSILQGLPVSELIASEPQQFSDERSNGVSVPATFCWVGRQWIWEGVQFEILHPDTLNTRKRNDHSCVLHVRAGSQSILFTGDIEAGSERSLLARMGDKLKSTVLIVPHHGSRTSSSLAFLRGVQPKYAVVTTGYKNQYGHPKPDVMARYQTLGIPTLETVKEGAITFVLKNQETLEAPKRYRVEQKRYWHD